MPTEIWFELKGCIKKGLKSIEIGHDDCGLNKNNRYFDTIIEPDLEPYEMRIFGKDDLRRHLIQLLEQTGKPYCLVCNQFLTESDIYDFGI